MIWLKMQRASECGMEDCVVFFEIGWIQRIGSYTFFYKSACGIRDFESTWVFFGRKWAVEIPHLVVLETRPSLG